MNLFKSASLGAVFLFIALAAQSQTFNTAFTGAIPDNNTEVCFPIVVSALPSQIDTSFGLVSVCLDITHTYVGDLRITLKAPNNTTITLANHVGGSGDNYTNTCFRENGVNGWITSGSAPFTGYYIPEESLNLMNLGMDPNGIWYICVRDEVPVDAGTFNGGSITFGPNPPHDPGLPPGICSVSNASGCLCPDSTLTDCDLLPDMTASALIIQTQHTEYPGYMTLSNATPNIGYGPLEIRGVNSCYCDTVLVGCSTPLCPDGSYPKQLITQRIYHKNGQTMTTWDRPAGTMTYHPTHGHMHVDNWATYTLHVGTTDPDPLNWPMVGEGAKTSFCLVNLGSCSGNPGYCVDSNGNTITGNDIPNTGLGSVSGCGTEQGIFVGSLDIYSQGLSGQQINFPGICNGDYYIISYTDPENNVLETDETNNYAVVPVTLTQQGTGPANPTFNYVVNGLSVNFISNVPGVTSYLWNFGDGDSSNVNAVTHVFPAPGTYNVMLQLYNGSCNANVAQLVTVDNTVGIAEQQQSVTDLNIFPNPADGHTTVSYRLDKESEVHIEVISSLGSVEQVLVSGFQPGGEHRVTVDNLAPGVHMVRLTSGSSTRVIRLVNLKP